MTILLLLLTLQLPASQTALKQFRDLRCAGEDGTSRIASAMVLSNKRVLTAAHISCTGPMEVKERESWVELSLVKLDTEADLQLMTPVDPKVKLTGPFVKWEEKPFLGEPVVAFSSALSYLPEMIGTYTEGRVMAFSANWIALDMTVLPGMSGAAIVNSEGYTLGMVIRMHFDGPEEWPVVTYGGAVSTKRIKKFLETR